MNTVFYSLASRGLEADVVKVEVEHYRSNPGTVIVGLGDKAVQESKERVRAALKNCNFAFPRGKVVINLAPADIPKSGPCFDLPIALGLISLSRQISFPSDSRVAVFGELSLDGTLRGICGVLGLVAEAQKKGFKKVLLPAANVAEACLVPNIEVYGIESLSKAVELFSSDFSLQLPNESLVDRAVSADGLAVNLSEIKGQFHAKRALEIAAAGGHNLLFSGPPGSGKTLLAKALQGLLPPLSFEESLEVTKIYSLAGLLPSQQALVHQRPFRVIHHTASGAALVGGGKIPRPGEISLAHRGVLFLDEMPEFPSSVLELLRQPLEDRQITISRARGSLTFPAQFMLCGAMNPCPCGFYGVVDCAKECFCNPLQVARYQSRLSGPLRDRIDLYCPVSPVRHHELSSVVSEDSEAVLDRVQKARSLQQNRFSTSAVLVNAEMSVRDLESFCPLSAKVKSLLAAAVDQFQLSARGYYRILKVARTIADLDASESLTTVHISEALQYRPS